MQEYSVEMFKKQRRDIKKRENYRRLTHFQILRLARKVDGNIFGDECVEYLDYESNNNKLNFSVGGIKLRLLKVLHHNFIDDIEDLHYIVNNCGNAKCCCLKHITPKKSLRK